MKILNQIINKFLTLSEENMLKNNYKRAIWQFYSAYNIACGIIDFKDRNLRKKNSLFKNILLSPESLDSVNFKKMQRYMKEDMRVISDAIKLIQERSAMTFEYSNFAENPLRVGILAHELQE